MAKGLPLKKKTRFLEPLKMVLAWSYQYSILHNGFYYMEKSVLLGTKPLVDSIRHFIPDPSGVFSVCHLCECRIVQWRHDSRLLFLLNWFLHIIKRTLHVGSKIWILCSRGKNTKFISTRYRVISSLYFFFISFGDCRDVKRKRWALLTVDHFKIHSKEELKSNSMRKLPHVNIN